MVRRQAARLSTKCSQCGLEHLELYRYRGGQEGLQDLVHLGIAVLLITLGIHFRCPKADVQRGLFDLLREEGQHLQEASLLPEDGYDLVLEDLDELCFLLWFKSKFKNTDKHKMLLS